MYQMKEKQDLTIIVSSCDRYKDAWDPFFKLFHKNWPTCPFPIVFNTETLTYSSNEVNFRTFFAGKGKAWSRQLKECLMTINTEFVLCMLEDFFLLSPVNMSGVSETLEIMRDNTKIGMVTFKEEKQQFWKLGKRYNEHFIEVKRGSQYRINAVLSLWRRDFLLNILRENENAWQFEVYGTRRALFSFKQILCYDPELPLPFDYHTWPGYGIGILHGKWLRGNVKLFEENGFVVDFSNLGFCEWPEETRQEDCKDNVEISWWLKIRRVIRFIRSFW